MDDAIAAALRRALSALTPVDEAEVAALASLASWQEFPAGAWLLRGGERAEWCWLVVGGLVRELYVDGDGAEHTRAFVAEGQLTGSLLDLMSDAPAVTFIEALEPTRTIAYRYRDFDRLTARFAGLARAARRNAELLYVRKTRREHEMLALSAAERYRRWREAQPALDARVSRKQLASYLGITPEHLSRLGSAARPARAPRRSR